MRRLRSSSDLDGLKASQLRQQREKKVSRAPKAASTVSRSALPNWRSKKIRSNAFHTVESTRWNPHGGSKANRLVSSHTKGESRKFDDCGQSGQTVDSEVWNPNFEFKGFEFLTSLSISRAGSAFQSVELGPCEACFPPSFDGRRCVNRNSDRTDQPEQY